MAPVSFGAALPPVGLDIGTDFIRAAQIKAGGASHSLTAYGIAPMPFGAVVEGEVVDPEAVSAAIKELWHRSGVRNKSVAVGVSNQKVVVRLVDLPYMERAELAGAIQYQAQDYIPIPIEEAIIDFQIIGDYMTPADEHMMEVLLVAAQRDMIGNIVSAVEGAGLQLAQVDVTAFALVRALLGATPKWLSEEAENPAEAVGIVHISSGLTNIAVVERGLPRFTRVSSLAANQFTQAIANVMNLTFDEAENLKARAGLPDIDQPAESHPDLDAATLSAVQDALEREANKFIAEVRRSFDYYLTQAVQVRSIGRIYLTGTGAELRNLPVYLGRGLQTEVVLGDALAGLQMSGSVESSVLPDRAGCAAAIGLALGGVV
ncbi:MAG: type IV pilus assembly protein PilM [Coriobacteriia bacterium]|nr:type IV pilus assembly protein PilM [Coriobacteriia bacterium]